MISRPATTADFDAICHVLADTNLQTSDVSPQIGVFVVAEINGEIVGTAGVEQYGAVALLRSVATLSRMRGKGVALRLCAESIHTAREQGVRELYLLTTTAPTFFEKLGFGRVARGAAPDAIRQTCEFRELCPESAVLMRKELDAAAARAAVVRVRDAYAAFLRGQVVPLVHLLAPNAVYHLPGRHMGGGRLQGREAILGRAAAALGACDAPPTVRLLGGRGDASVVLTDEQYSARRRSNRLDQRVCVVWRLEQGLCVEVWAHFEDQDTVDVFWAGWSIPGPAE